MDNWTLIVMIRAMNANDIKKLIKKFAGSNDKHELAAWSYLDFQLRGIISAEEYEQFQDELESDA